MSCHEHYALSMYVHIYAVLYAPSFKMDFKVLNVYDFQVLNLKLISELTSGK
jgi:hypothetical protein